MGVLVQKYGGTSVGDPERIRHVARRCLAAQRAGNDLVVVVSAMAGETNRLLSLVHQVASRPDPREQDVVLAAGEQVAVGLVALAIRAEGGRARSYLGHQVRIVTDSAFTRARIQQIDAEAIRAAHAAGEIAVVAGFQGIDEEGNVTTLGRGGSDTSAVAVAAALRASCEIYTDVEGVFTADPSICPRARLLERIRADEMMELSSLGAKVLQIRSVELALNHRVPLRVRSTFSDHPGTHVVPEDTMIEEVLVAGVAHDRDEALVALHKLPPGPALPAEVFQPLAEAGISVDVILQSARHSGLVDFTFTVKRADLARALEIVAEVARRLGAPPPESDPGVAKVSIVGSGMRTHAGVAARMFRVLADAGVAIRATTTSEIKVSCLVPEEAVERAVNVLHAAFGLDA